MFMDELINVGLIGYGMSGRIFHAPFLKHVSGFNLSKIYTTNPTSIAHAQLLYPDTVIEHDVFNILADPEIELIFILTPNETHFELAREALLAGKHVVVDKPFTATVAQANELIALAQKQKRILTVYHNRRLTADYLTLKKILESDVLGELVEYTACYDRYVPDIRPKKWKEEPREASGVLYDLGSHLIDQVLHLFGMPLEITSTIRYQREHTAIDDYFMLTLQYPYLTVFLHSGMLVRTPGPNFLVHGKKGSFVKYGLDVQEENLNAGMIPVGDDWGREPEHNWGMLTLQKKNAIESVKIRSEQGNYSEFFVNLKRAIRENHELLVKPEEARDVIALIELAIQSNREKRTLRIQKTCN